MTPGNRPRRLISNEGINDEKNVFFNKLKHYMSWYITTISGYLSYFHFATLHRRVKFLFLYDFLFILTNCMRQRTPEYMIIPVQIEKKNKDRSTRICRKQRVCNGLSPMISCSSVYLIQFKNDDICKRWYLLFNVLTAEELPGFIFSTGFIYLLRIY